MPVSQIQSGPNSAIVEYTTGSDFIEILDEMKLFVESHGQEAVDTAYYDVGSRHNIMTYRALNKDGVTYKYMQLYYYNTNNYGFGCRVFESYDSTTQVGTNMAHLSDDIANYHQICNPLNQNGRFHLFATARYFCMLHIGVDIGSYVGNGATGCFETTQANDGDDTPNFGWINTYLATSMYYSSYYRHQYLMCFPRTAKYTGSAAGVWTKFSTPIGDWGGGIQTGSDQTYYTMKYSIPSNPPPFGATVKHHVFDLMVSSDEHLARYVKGQIYGLKAFTTNIGSNGDVFSVKCNADMFLSNAGSDLDHFMICHGIDGTFGLPL